MEFCLSLCIHNGYEWIYIINMLLANISHVRFPTFLKRSQVTSGMRIKNREGNLSLPEDFSSLQLLQLKVLQNFCFTNHFCQISDLPLVVQDWHS